MFSYGEGFGEITDTDLLAYEMQEVIRPDIELALIRDQVDSLKRLSAEELERRMAEARQSAYGMALPLSKYLPEYISGRLTDEARAEFDDSLHGLLCSSADDAVGPGLNWIRELFRSVTGTGLGSRMANLKRLLSLEQATGLLSVTALYYVDPWLYNTGSSRELPAGVQKRLMELAEPVRAVFSSH